MYFCSETMILQNVFDLARKQSTNLVDCHDRPKDFKHTTDIIMDGLSEIIDGLDLPRDALEKENWKYKIHSILFYKLIITVYQPNICDNIEEINNDTTERTTEKDGARGGGTDMIHLSQLLPDFSPHLYFSVVERFGMEEFLLECLGLLPSDTYWKILKDLRDYIHSYRHHDASDIVLLSTYLKALLLQLFTDTSRPDIEKPTKASCDYRCEHLLDITENFSKLLKSSIITQYQDYVFDSIVTTLLILLTFSNDRKASESLCQDYNLKDKISLCDVYDKDMDTLMLDSKIVVPKLGECCCKVSVQMTDILNRKFNHSDWLELLHSLLNCVDVSKIHERFNECADSLICPLFPLVPIGKKFCVHVLKLFEYFQDVSLRMYTNELVNKCSTDDHRHEPKCNGEIKKILDSVVRAIPVPYNADDGDVNFDDTEEILLCIRYRLEKYTDCLNHILKCDDLLTDDRIITFLEENNEVLVSENYFYLLLNKHTEFVCNKICSIDISTRLFNIVIEIFSRLPLCTQDSILCKRIIESKSTNNADKRKVEQMVVSSFNRLSLEDWQKTSKIFSQALFTDPIEVIKKSVDIAVKCKGQTELIVKLLIGYPRLCNLKEYAEKTCSTHLCGTLHDFIVSSSLNSKEEDNLIHFVALLLKNFHHSADDLDLWEVLSVPEFLTTSILPFLDLKNLQSDTQPVNLLLCMKLLNVVIQTYEGTRTDRIQLLPIIPCLCEVYHECIVLWDSSTDEKNIEKLNIKDLVICNIMQLIEHVVQDKRKHTDSLLVWLQKRIQSLYWTVHLLLADLLTLFSSTGSHTYWLENEAKKIIENSCDLDILVLLQYISVRDDTADAIIRHWRKDICIGNEKVIHSLSQLLPHCLLAEWNRIIKVLNRLIEVGSVQIPSCSEYFIFTEFSPSQGGRNELYTLQILCQTLILMTAGQDLPNVAWNHIASCFVSIAQALVTDCLEQEKLVDGRKLILSQSLGHISVVTSLVPKTAADTLLVLIMNITNKYKGIKVSRSVLANRGTAMHTKGNSSEVNSDLLTTTDLYNEQTDFTNIGDKMDAHVTKCIRHLPDSEQKRNLLKISF